MSGGILSFAEIKKLYHNDHSAEKVLVPRYDAGFLEISRWDEVIMLSDRFPGLEMGSRGIIVILRAKENEVIQSGDQFIVAYFPTRRFQVCGEYIFNLSPDDIYNYWGKP